MKKSDLTKKQKDELELFGANTWFVESLHKQYLNNPDLVPEQWRQFFKNQDSAPSPETLSSPETFAPGSPAKPSPADSDFLETPVSKTLSVDSVELNSPNDPGSPAKPSPADSVESSTPLNQPTLQNALGSASKSSPLSSSGSPAKSSPISSSSSSSVQPPNFPVPGTNDESIPIVGSSARILDNMNSSLTVPVATSQRTIPVKLLEENRIIINRMLKRSNVRVSFTHIIGWAILNAVKTFPVMNYAFTLINGKPHLIKRKTVNLGLAIDLEKKDGSRSLIVPNIKNADAMSFKQFLNAYDNLVARSRKGLIDPSEFASTTVTLTNPGTIGTVQSVPRLMIGQGTIIAVGSIQYPAEYQAMAPATISALGISKVMNITSTYDHRIIQGAESGLFLKEVHQLLLGEKNFYEDIFNGLHVPSQPVKWMTDYRPGAFASSLNFDEIEKQARVLQLINMYRVRGHLVASLDPLGTQSPYHPELDLALYNFTMWDLDREFITGGFSGIKTASLRKILDILQQTYCDKIGVEYMHIQNPDEKTWLQSKMEPVMNTPSFSNTARKLILEKLITAETFEHFIHTKYTGHKRFSLEGSETIIPVLDLILNKASESGILEVVLGMAHRGRLNVLANIIGKSFESIFSEFEDIKDPESIEGSGDVKYHLGASGEYKTAAGKTITVSVASNPSHLEWVNPVVEGIVRAKQTRLDDNKEHKKIMPLLIHGDAAMAGQGIVAETLNLSQLSGYRTGGTVHIIINNQIGFTTLPEDARSSQYASDVAKMIQAPIFHVNGDDPEASLWVAGIAFEYRQRFHKDVVIDLLGYRRWGHNEGDEPGFTQPLLYAKIKNHPSVMTQYAIHLVKNKILTESEIKTMNDDVYNRLSIAFDSQIAELPPSDSASPNPPPANSQSGSHATTPASANSNSTASPNPSPANSQSGSHATTPASANSNSTTPPSPPPADAVSGPVGIPVPTSTSVNTIPPSSESNPAPPVPTSVSADLLNEIVSKITTVPDGFNLHPKLRKFLDKRKEFAAGSAPADWALAEALAFGTLLIEGTPVRLSGQDSVRGTFSQRHLALSDITNGSEYVPLNNISPTQARLEALDSLLSEAAVLGFEYGYSTADPLALVLWEAQFGDFDNAAQVIIDNFIAVSYEKWQLRNSVVLLLPHGYEGQGPEHSSARLERFLTLCAQDNLQVCYITTPAQYFHLLRRQIKNPERKPLVLITPKSLLRLPEARSPRNQFISGKFLEIIDDDINPKNSVKRIILTSGKVYYELAKFRTENKITDTAIIRIEQYYPYRSDLLKEILSPYNSSDKVVWVQEEPKNMGAWNFLSARLIGDLPPTCMLFYSGRPESASPAVGSSKISTAQQSDLISSAFSL